MAVSLQAQGVREQRAGGRWVKKLLKQQQSPSQLAEAWNACRCCCCSTGSAIGRT
jgi:DNA polymerase-3 subunit delta'